MNKTIIAFLQNGGEGAWINLPASRDDFQKTLREIGSTSSDAISISEYKSDVAPMPIDLLKNTELDLVNYLAARLAGMDGTQLIKLNAVMESPMRFTTLDQIIEYTYNTDYFLLIPGISNVIELAQYDIFDTGLCQMPDEWKHGIDLEKFGTHIVEQEQGVFTSKGYLTMTGDEWKNVLSEHGIPNQYRLF